MCIQILKTKLLTFCRGLIKCLEWMHDWCAFLCGSAHQGKMILLLFDINKLIVLLGIQKAFWNYMTKCMVDSLPSRVQGPPRQAQQHQLHPHNLHLQLKRKNTQKLDYRFGIYRLCDFIMWFMNGENYCRSSTYLISSFGSCDILKCWQGYICVIHLLTYLTLSFVSMFFFMDVYVKSV